MKCPWRVPTICYIGRFFRDMLAEFSDTLGIYKSNNVLGESHLNDTVNYLIVALLCVQAQKQTALHKKSAMQRHPTVHMRPTQTACPRYQAPWYMMEDAPTRQFTPAASKFPHTSQASCIHGWAIWNSQENLPATGVNLPWNQTHPMWLGKNIGLRQWDSQLLIYLFLYLPARENQHLY